MDTTTTTLLIGGGTVAAIALARMHATATGTELPALPNFPQSSEAPVTGVLPGDPTPRYVLPTLAKIPDLPTDVPVTERPPTPPPHAPNTHPRLDLRLGTFNVLKTTTPAQTNKTLGRLIRHGDVFGLGEFDKGHSPVFAWLKTRGWDHFKGGGQTPIVWNGNRYRKIDSGDFALNRPRKVEAKHGNALTRHWQTQRANWVQLEDKETGHRFFVINAHTIPAVVQGTKPVREQVKLEQFRNLARATNHFAKHGEVFVTGDLNLSPFERQWPKAILGSAHLRSNWDWLGAKGFGHGTMGRRFIDNILSLTNVHGLRVQSHAIYDGGSSDHRAVIARYLLP